MTKNNFDGFEVDNDIKLTDEEEKLLLGIKDSKSILNKQLTQQYQQIAINQKKRTKQLSMRLTDDDYLLAKSKSIEEGIPYQALFINGCMEI